MSTDHDNNVRKLEDTHKRIQSLQSELHNKRSELDDIQNSLAEAAAHTEPLSHELTTRALQTKANTLKSRCEEAERSASAQADSLLQRLISVRNLKENVDSTTQWLSELNHTFLNGHSQEQSEEDYDRVRADLLSRKDILVKSLSAEPLDNKQLEQLLAKIDLVGKEVESKANSQRSLHADLAMFSREYDTLVAFCQVSSGLLSSVDVVSGHIGAERLTRLEAVARITALNAQVVEVEKPKCMGLANMLSEVKYKHWPKVLTDLRLKTLEADVAEVAERLGQLESCSLVKLAELQQVLDMCQRYECMRLGVEAYLQGAETQVLGLEPVAIGKGRVGEQMEELQLLQREHEVRSRDLVGFNEFGALFLSVVGKLGKVGAESRPTEVSEMVARDVERLNGAYRWAGERLGERRRELVESLERGRAYWQEVARAEVKLSEAERRVVGLFGVEGCLELEKPVRLPVSGEGLRRVAAESKVLMEANNVLADDELSKLKGKRLVMDLYC